MVYHVTKEQLDVLSQDPPSTKYQKIAAFCLPTGIGVLVTILAAWNNATWATIVVVLSVVAVCLGLIFGYLALIEKDPRTAIRRDLEIRAKRGLLPQGRVAELAQENTTSDGDEP